MLKIADLLKLPSMGQSYIVAGHDGIFNVIKKLEVMEEPYPSVVKFLTPNCFSLTNLWSMKNEKENRYKLIEAMINRHCAGIGIMPGPHLNNVIDEEILALANEHAFPIIYISESTRWGDVIAEYGVLFHLSVSPAQDVGWEDVLDIFSDYHTDCNISLFCSRIGGLLNLPIIMSTETVYSSNSNSINVALVVSRIQTVSQNGRSTITSPIMVRIDQDLFAVVCFGQRTMVACCVMPNDLNDSVLGTYYKIAPSITKELDKSCPVPYFARNAPNLQAVESDPMYIVLVKTRHVRNIERELDFEGIVYEKNIYFSYSILLIPSTFKKAENIYQLYQAMIRKLEPSLFVFSQVCYMRKELLNEIEPLKYIINTLSYIEGIYSMDELPLLYILARSPYEYQMHIFSNSLLEKGQNAERQFLNTMRLYLVLHNIVDVSNLLDIHSNTVKYRLTKVLDHFGFKEEKALSDLPQVQLLVLLEFLLINT